MVLTLGIAATCALAFVLLHRARGYSGRSVLTAGGCGCGGVALRAASRAVRRPAGLPAELAASITGEV